MFPSHFTLFLVSAGRAVLVIGLVGLIQDGLEWWFHTVRRVILLVQELYPQLLGIIGCLSRGEVGNVIACSEIFMASACIAFCR